MMTPTLYVNRWFPSDSTEFPTYPQSFDGMVHREFVTHLGGVIHSTEPLLIPQLYNISYYEYQDFMAAILPEGTYFYLDHFFGMWVKLSDNIHEALEFFKRFYDSEVDPWKVLNHNEFQWGYFQEQLLYPAASAQ